MNDDVTSLTRVTFLEIEPWEASQVKALCPANWVTQMIGQDINHAGIVSDPDCNVLSPFIYSHIDEAVLQHLPGLRMIATRSTGFDHIDADACRRRGIVVCNVPDYGANTVAEHSFALMLALSRKVFEARSRTLRGDFSFKGLMGFDLKDKVLGVVGSGNIGRHVIRIAKGFEMNVIVHDPLPDADLARLTGFDYVEFDTVLARSDIISLHCPLTPHTQHLLNRAAFARMKKGITLINTARGALIDTDALLWALDEGIVSGVGLDVLEHEQDIREERELLASRHDDRSLCDLIRNHVLLKDDRVLITPHIAFNSREAVARILQTTTDNIKGFLAGHPPNRVI